LHPARRSEIGIQCIESASSTRNTLELGDASCNFGSRRHNESVKSIHRFGQPAVDGLPDVPNSYFLIENDL